MSCVISIALCGDEPTSSRSALPAAVMLLIRCCCCCLLLVSASAALGDEDFREDSENNLIPVIEEQYLTLLLLNSDDKKAATKSSSSFSAENPPFIPVCCQTGYYFKRNLCIKSDNAMLAPEFPQIYTPDLQPSNKTPDDFPKVYQYLCETDSFGIYPGVDDFYLLENGTIFTENLTSPNLITQIDYCMTVHMDADNNSLTVIAVCLPPDSSIPMLYSIFNLMSAIFLLGTFFIYTVISDLKNIHGIIVRAYVSVLTVAYFALAVVQLGDQYVLERLPICQALELGSQWLRDKRDEGRKAWQIRKGGSCAISGPRAAKLVATMPSISALGLLVLLFLSLTSYPLYLSFPSTATDQPCHDLLSISLENATEVFANGSVLFDGLTFPKPTQYRDEKGRLRGCPCLVKKCIRFCCQPGEIHDKLHKDRPVLCHKPSTNETDENFDLPPLPDGVLDASVGGYEDFYTIHRQGCVVPKQATIYLSGKMVMKSDSPSITAHGHFKLEHTRDAVVKTYIHEPDSYCVAYSRKHNASKIRLCNSPSEARKEKMENAMRWSETAGSWLSVIFLIATFTVYSLFPVLRNLPGKTLMAHVASMALAYIFLPFIKHAEIQNSILDIDGCKTMAYIVHFSFLASFFWLNVMCFDIWWTFGLQTAMIKVPHHQCGFRSLHGSVKQRERKKFIMYSIYAWGCASTLTTVCMIMDLVPGIPAHIIRPEFGRGSCWFNSNKARAIYFYGPMGVTVICNICLFILTAHKILKHKKDTARQLKGSDSKRHDDNKQWFNLYLKLFIVMGINWSMEIISWLLEDKLPKSVWYITDLTNTLQGVIIFIIFVWKDKIRRLLVKRFGCKGNNFLSRNSTSRSGCPTSSTSRTTCVTAAPLQEKINPYADSYRGKATVTDESDCI
ncbi:G-protein coupled receptor Mth2 isoform X1 [Nasonia vitripennis]|uniref:G-protein coupled receptors family 2 profile 2 domain-containing protein n=1 Tax=Nasonia vitripennis TaxID=7425 RepID=A0A7M7PYY4_NASVI|nr:G-protein coupled receptor Mth2 isoform X1 [Nasonia vitripennis]